VTTEAATDVMHPQAEDGRRDHPIVQRELIVVGASAGGVEALRQLVADLPPEVPAPVLIVLHMASVRTSVLDNILRRAGGLPVGVAVDGEPLERGRVYIAPPDFHMLVRGESIRLSAGPRENGVRPAIDPLFRSAGRAYGARAVGVILSGTLDDGATGLRFIKEHGGAAVVQDPDDAAFSDMPRNAILATRPDAIVPLAEMGATLSRLLDQPIDKATDIRRSDGDRQEADRVEVDLEPPSPGGEPTLITCPDCGGVLMEGIEHGALRFTCQVGHSYSPESLVNGQGLALEAALWNAHRTLDERADLLRRLARRARGGDGAVSTDAGERYDMRALAIERHVKVIREALVRLRETENDERDVPERA
jgi:two-component system, chemotaxis family, protein-glutamate methylesterase/glutaminase